MKLGMMDVGIFCKEPRFGISTEKGTMFKRDTGIIHTRIPRLLLHSLTFQLLFSHLLTVFFYVFIPDCSITKFLNRILGLEVHKQNHLFQYFTDNFDYLIEKDKKEGKYDMGILGMVHLRFDAAQGFILTRKVFPCVANRCCVFPTDLAPGNDEIYEEKQETFLTVGNPQDGQVVLYKVGTAQPHLRHVFRWLGRYCEQNALLNQEQKGSIGVADVGLYVGCHDHQTV